MRDDVWKEGGKIYFIHARCNEGKGKKGLRPRIRVPSFAEDEGIALTRHFNEKIIAGKGDWKVGQRQHRPLSGEEATSVRKKKEMPNSFWRPQCSTRCRWRQTEERCRKKAEKNGTCLFFKERRLSYSVGVVSRGIRKY